MPRTGQPAVRHIAAVTRAVSVLEALAGGEPELGTSEIARRVGINASTVSRLLATLTEARLVEHVPASGRYRLGVGLLELGDAVLARLDLRESARPHLVALVEETGETATLSVPAEHEAITVDFVPTGSSVQSVARLGRPSVAHATAVGKVYLAFGGRLPDGQLATFTGRTVTDREVLDREIAQVVEQGFARALGEREEDLNAIAAPIRNRQGTLVGILGVQGPASRFGPGELGRAVEPLLVHARAISAGLGSAPEPSRS
jgi:IclR family acetate operon transcriptional repressor